MEQVALAVICSIFDFPSPNVYIKDGSLFQDVRILKNTGGYDSYYRFALPTKCRDMVERDIEGIRIIDTIKSHYAKSYQHP